MMTSAKQVMSAAAALLNSSWNGADQGPRLLWPFMQRNSISSWLGYAAFRISTSTLRAARKRCVTSFQFQTCQTASKNSAFRFSYCR